MVKGNGRARREGGGRRRRDRSPARLGREPEDEGEDRYLVPDTSVARSKTSLFPKTLASTTFPIQNAAQQAHAPNRFTPNNFLYDPSPKCKSFSLKSPGYSLLSW